MKSIIVILALTLGSMTVLAGEQKTENYGYFETNNTTVSIPEIKENTVANTKVDVSTNTSTDISISNSSKAQFVDKPIDSVKDNKVVGADHSAFDALLKAHVSRSGKVDYAAIKSKVAALDNYLGYLSQNVPTTSASKNERLAFWINAYNANTIKLIVDNYPVASIMDLYGGKAFDEKWIKIGGETLSLNDIENNKIRAKFNESRIHFAVNCAAKSCPPILNKAWTADNVQANLEARAIAFVNDTAYNKVSSESVKISKIFEWYAKDFPADIVGYLNKYSKTKIGSKAAVNYIEYDWALNGK